MAESKSVPLLTRIRVWVVLGFAAYWVVLFTLTHIPIDELPGPTNLDKILHCLAYAGLIGLAGLAMATRGEGSPAASFALIPVFMIYSFADELLQIPAGRKFEFADLLADWLGLLIGASICWALLKFLPGLWRKPERD